MVRKLLEISSLHPRDVPQSIHKETVMFNFGKTVFFDRDYCFVINDEGAAFLLGGYERMYESGWRVACGCGDCMSSEKEEAFTKFALENGFGPTVIYDYAQVALFQPEKNM